MKINILTLRNSINKAYLKVKPNRTQIEIFKKNIINLFNQIKESESEEFHKNIISEFFKNTYYSPNNYINTKGRADLVIHNGKDSNSNVGVLFELKKLSNKSEMPTCSNINTKAFQELVLYFLRERIIHKNIEIKYLVATNILEWFIFNASDFEKLFASDKNFIKQFEDFENERLSGKTTDFFYKNIAEPFINRLESEINITHFDIRDFETIINNANKEDDNKLIALYKIFSPEHLLKLPFANDSNSLDKTFYNELLHIIGLEESNEGGRKLIGRKNENKRNPGSLIENSITILKYDDCLSQLHKVSDFGNNKKEQLFNISLELVITWINRILFLKLLEGQLIKYNNGDKSLRFLNSNKIPDFDELNKMFFQVLAVKQSDRSEVIKHKFGNIPYLNSSLFEPSELEYKTIRINSLDDSSDLPILPGTVLKDETGKKLTGHINPLQYLFKFLDSYDFSSEGSEDIQEENKTLINASVLGLIFEKINGYKDGSYFTPGFITQYMCHETITRAVIQKFNDAKGWNCGSLVDVNNKIEDKEDANKIINNLKICDPSVGSGHFLVSALNEILSIKSELKILMDRKGRVLRDYHFEVFNDELIVSDPDGELFEYNPKNHESYRVQEAIFHEKQTIIENCLFGVDINHNSVKICRLRLWIELLKHAYYKQGTLIPELETLPNIDINIKCGNSLISRYPLDANIKTALKSSKWTVDNYREAVMTYRNAENKEEKRKMENLISEIKSNFESEVSKNDKRFIKLNRLKGELLSLTTQKGLFDLGRKEKEEWNKKLKKLSDEQGSIEMQLEEIKNNKIYENAFEWRFEFPEVLNDYGEYIGFDAIIGNPPWGAYLTKSHKDYLKGAFIEIDSSTPNTFAYFIGLSNLICQNFITLILPDSFLVKDFSLTRSKLSQNLYSLFWCQNTAIPEHFRPFKDVEHDVCMMFLGPKSTSNCEIRMRSYAEGSINVSLIKRSKSDFILDEYDSVFNLLLTDLDIRIREKVVNLGKLNSLFQCHEGIHSGNIRNKLFVRNNVKGTEKNMYLGAKSGDFIDNFFSKTSGWFVDYDETVIQKDDGEYASLRDERIFCLPKIYITRTGDPFKAFLDENFYASNNFFSVQFIDYSLNNIESLKPILGLLNSIFANYFVRTVIAPSLGNTFIETKIIHLLKIPFPISLLNDKSLNDLVTDAIEAKKNIQKKRYEFLSTLINDRIFNLYNFSQDEIEWIRNSNNKSPYKEEVRATNMD